MDGIVCVNCKTWMPMDSTSCPGCQKGIIGEGENKNIIDRIEPNCLIHRYDGSDMLEPAIIIKEGKTNVKVATRLREYTKPVTLPKQKVYSFNHNLLSSIQALRNDRTATMQRYEQLIQSHWQNLKPFYE